MWAIIKGMRWKFMVTGIWGIGLLIGYGIFHSENMLLWSFCSGIILVMVPYDGDN